MRVIRRIRDRDCQQEFCTGKRTFAFDPTGKRLDLRFYLDRDRSGVYESYVLVVDGKVMGVLCIRRYRDFLYVSRVGVRKGFWGKGCGAELMGFVISKTMEYGYDRIFLEADEENIRFYEDSASKWFENIMTIIGVARPRWN